MPDTPLTRQTGRMLVKIILIGMIVQLLFIVYVFYQSYEGRVRVVNAQRAGCERAKLDRNANASGWRIAEGARRKEGNIIVATRYKNIAEGLEARSRIRCTTAFADASILP